MVDVDVDHLALFYNQRTVTVDVNGCIFLGRQQAALFITPINNNITFTMRNKSPLFFIQKSFQKFFMFILRNTCYKLEAKKIKKLDRFCNKMFKFQELNLKS